MAPGVEAVKAVKEFLDCLNFSLAPRCIESELNCLTGILATTNVSFFIEGLVKRLTQLNPDAECCRKCSLADGEANSTPLNRIDPATVQIQASKAEVDARIAAFISRKRIENDDSNVKEFTDVSRSNHADGMTCARARPSALPRRRAYDGRIKLARVRPCPVSVSRVSSVEVKVTSSNDVRETPAQAKMLTSGVAKSVVSQRCKQLECHLGMMSDLPEGNPYERLKRIEERVLQLEAQSPEYILPLQNRGPERAIMATTSSTSLLKSSSATKATYSHSQLQQQQQRTHYQQQHAANSRSLLTSHPYGQSRCSLVATQCSSPLSSRCSADEESNSVYACRLRDGLGMKPFDAVT
ncbi:MAP3K12-binding inhibitory protein 1-like [Sycon ciliatum]|uniref:MAP3K12-binding inhibitory protein 1-like n=1 Tax=Sycon ciliatum TaxID=27933 RepID=UPI0020AD21D3|eukprot:scpid56201/ scgid33799/ 